MSPISHRQLPRLVPPQRLSGPNASSACPATQSGNSPIAPQFNNEPALEQCLHPDQPSNGLDRPAKRARAQPRPQWASAFVESLHETAPARSMGGRDHHEVIDEPPAIWQTLTEEELETLLSPDPEMAAYVAHLIRLENTQEQPGLPVAPQGDPLMVNKALGAATDAAPADARAVEHRVRPVADNTLQPEALLTSLMGLGYTQKQAKAIHPKSRNEVIKHHTNLVALDFSHAEIVKISQRAQSLAHVAKGQTMALFRILPDLTTDQFVAVAKSRTGDLALEELLRVAEDLKAAPLHLNAEQLTYIARQGARPALYAVHLLRHKFHNPPFSLTSAQVVKIASSIGGQHALDAVKAHRPALTQEPYSLNAHDVVKIAGKDGGQLALQAVRDHMLTLISQPYFLDREDVVQIASRRGGQLALKAVKDHLLTLINKPYDLTPGDVVRLAKQEGGQLAVEAVKAHLMGLISAPYFLDRNDVVKIAGNGGQKGLLATKHRLDELTSEPYNMIPRDLLMIVKQSGRCAPKALNALKNQWLEMANEPQPMEPSVGVSRHFSN